MCGVDADEWDGEARPELALELFEDGALCEDEDAFTGAALDELGEEDADFDGFTGTDGIGDQDGWPDVFECFEGWFLLDGLDIGSGLVPEGDACGVGLCGADEGFEEESAVGVIWACVWLEACVFGPDELDVIEFIPEDPGFAFGDAGDADAMDGKAASGGFCASDEPLFTAAFDACAGRRRGEESHVDIVSLPLSGLVG